MIDRTTFDECKKRFGGHVSWAYWTMPSSGEKATAHCGDVSALNPDRNADLLSVLNVRYVLFGLNLSRQLLADGAAFRNFHDAGSYSRDYRLRCAVRGTQLWGAYTTDVFVDLVDSKASRVMTQVRSNPDEVLRQVSERKTELSVLGASKATLVALGNAVHALLQQHFGEFRIIRIPHYAARIKLDDYRARVINTLQSSETLS